MNEYVFIITVVYSKDLCLERLFLKTLATLRKKGYRFLVKKTPNPNKFDIRFPFSSIKRY